MNCDQALEQISAALDAELAGGDLADLEAHLASCPACRALYEELRGIQDELLESVEDPPEDFHNRLMAAVAAEPVPVAGSLPAVKKSRRRAWAGIAAAAAVAALVLFPQWDGQGNSGGNGAAIPMMADAPAGGEEAVPAEDGAILPSSRSMEDCGAPMSDGMEKSVLSDAQPTVPPLAAAPEAPAMEVRNAGGERAGLPENSVCWGVVTVEGELPEGYTWDENGALELTEEELPQLVAALEEAGIPYTVESGEGEGTVLVVRLEVPGEQTNP